MTTIYLVTCEDAIEHQIACATLKEARQVSRDVRGGGDGTIYRVEVPNMPVRELLCAAFNRTGFVAGRQEIKPRARAEGR